jgi:hypothetical protein
MKNPMKAKINQKEVQHKIGPWLITVGQKELKGPRRAHKGWSETHYNVNLEHIPLELNLWWHSGDNSDSNDQFHLARELDEFVSYDELKWFADPLGDLKKIVLDLVEQFNSKGN